MRLMYFAWVRERIGTGQQDVSPPSAVDTVAALVAWLATLWGAAALTLVTGWDYLRVGLKHMD